MGMASYYRPYNKNEVDVITGRDIFFNLVK